jgi:hypothetical protein
VSKVTEQDDVISIIHKDQTEHHFRDELSDDFQLCTDDTLSFVKKVFMSDKVHTNVDLNDIVSLYSNHEDETDVYVVIK